MDATTHVARVRTATTALLNAFDGVRNAQHEYEKAGMGEAVTDQVMIDTFGSKTVEGLEVPLVSAAEFQAVLYSFGQIMTLVDNGHATNLYKVKN